jgi:hypothetical protein
MYGNLKEEMDVFPFSHRIDVYKYTVYDYVLKKLIGNESKSVLVINLLDSWFQTIYEDTIVLWPYPHAKDRFRADDPRLPLFKNLTALILSGELEQLYKQYNISIIIVSSPYVSQWQPVYIRSFMRDFTQSLLRIRNQISRVRILQLVSINSGDALAPHVYSYSLEPGKYFVINIPNEVILNLLDRSELSISIEGILKSLNVSFNKSVWPKLFVLQPGYFALQKMWYDIAISPRIGKLSLRGGFITIVDKEECNKAWIPINLLEIPVDETSVKEFHIKFRLKYSSFHGKSYIKVYHELNEKSKEVVVNITKYYTFFDYPFSNPCNFRKIEPNIRLGDKYSQGLWSLELEYFILAIGYDAIRTAPIWRNSFSGDFILVDATFYHNNTFFTLHGDKVMTFGTIRFVPSKSYWLWHFKNFESDEYVHILWFPPGSKIVFRRWKGGTIGDPVAEYVINSSHDKVVIPPGKYLVEAVIPLSNLSSTGSGYIIELLVFNFTKAYNGEPLTTYVIWIRPKD